MVRYVWRPKTKEELQIERELNELEEDERKKKDEDEQMRKKKEEDEQMRKKQREDDEEILLVWPSISIRPKKRPRKPLVVDCSFSSPDGFQFARST